MTDDFASSVDSPHELLSSVRNLTRQVRIAQRSTWFPLLVFAAITLAAIPVYRYSPHELGQCRSGPGGTAVCSSYTLGVLVYWPVALLLSYSAIVAFYIHQSRLRGVGTRIRPFVIIGAVIAVIVVAGSLWRAQHLASQTQLIPARPHASVLELSNATAAIGLALLVLAWFERNRVLAAFSVVYLAVILGSYRVGWGSHPSQWHFLPQLLLPVAMLLVASVGFALIRPAAERPPR
jgi:hypothetical protein